ncbi:gp34.22 [Bacillus phage SPO1]|uniref:Gp34.22 n=3 Tax=Okubovirus TaxID=1857845 RepID=B6V2T9_BPSP1|nr:gp34.22 [Bacillus phage SPO1]YP_008770099.1 hypothetical protein CampHawk_165 [Bacillus phage CampHawk]APZ82401.1 hypothetical protein Goe2_c16500 [Bacillus phage vB_BsuM-Goe2]UNY49117.1 hypothetical protein sp82g_180 [Bacillus phage SP82G]ACI91066.1 gp34.22 [Bacillus phage SPO1]AGY47043.1 hypothetical protein CampHawk_165 [Bacillus phage CampHawk]
MGWLPVDKETFIKHVEDNKLKRQVKAPLDQNTIYLNEAGNSILAFEYVAPDNETHYRIWGCEKDILERLRNIADTQAREGEYDYDEFMYGMHIGCELMLATAENRDPVYKPRPDVWAKGNDDEL